MKMTTILLCAAALSAACAFGKDPKDRSARTSTTAKPLVLSGPYGIRIEADPGCEKGAKYILQRLKSPYLPRAVRYYGDPFDGKKPTREFTVRVKRNDGTGRSDYTGPSWGSCGDGIDSFTVGLAKGSDKWEMDLTLLASRILTVCQEDDGAALHIYANRFVEGSVTGANPVKQLKQDIKQGLEGKGEDTGRNRVIRKLAPKWAAFEELRKKHPTFILDYNKLKNKRFAEGKLSERISFSQTTALLGEVTGENVAEIFKRYGVPVAEGSVAASAGKSVAEILQECDFLLNKNFKKDAKYYLCLFSASWCGPCRAEMPRIAKTYAETLKSDPDIELIHFSRDRDEAKAKAWAKEHDVKFPVVKYNDGNPLDLHTSGIPHLFIIKADGTLVEDGHPMRLFTDEKLRALKQEQPSRADTPGSGSVRASTPDVSKAQTGPFGIRFEADPGCEKGAEYVLGKLVDVYLPRAKEYYGDPFVGKTPSRVYTIKVRRNDGSGRSTYTGPSYGPGTGRWSIGLSKGSDRYEMSLDYLASSVLTVCEDAKWASFVFYVNRIAEEKAEGVDPTPRLKEDIQKGLEPDADEKNKWYRAHAPLWAVLEELRERHPAFILDYCNLKNARYAEGRLPDKLSLDQMAALLGEVSGENVAELFKKYGVKE